MDSRKEDTSYQEKDCSEEGGVNLMKNLAAGHKNFIKNMLI